MQPNPLDRLRALWTKKPWTCPHGLVATDLSFVFGEPRTSGMRLFDPNQMGADGVDHRILLALAEHRLMDLLPEWWSVRRSIEGWSVCRRSGWDMATAPDRLTALIAFAESEDCHE